MLAVSIGALLVGFFLAGWLTAKNYHLGRSHLNSALSKKYSDLYRAAEDGWDRAYLLGRSVGVLDAGLVHLGLTPEHVSRDLERAK